jgi:pyruvate,water dikinase
MIQRISSTESSTPETAGGKGDSLITLSSAGFSVPDGVIVTTDLLTEVLKANDVYKSTQATLEQMDMTNFQDAASTLRETVEGLDVPTELRSQITESVAELGTDAVAVRSSAVAEDSKEASFAGLHESKLNVPTKPDTVMAAVRSCWKSLFTNRAIVYRLQKDIPHEGSMAVVIQEMIDSEISGITLTAHPMDSSNLMIEASYGYGDLIVGGEVDPDEYRINRGDLAVLNRTIGSKSKISQGADSGTTVSQAEESQTSEPVLTDGEATQVARKCMNIERLFSYPQDIEWCLVDSNLYILQSRPITGDAQ